MREDDVRRLFQHMWWADALARTALDRAGDPPAVAVELYAHILGAELVWLDRIEQTAQSVEVWPAVDLEGCRQLARRARERYEAFLAALSPDRLSELVHYTNSAGREFDTRLDDILIHVALHGSYHRGQVAIVLRGAGHEPNPTDYIGFVRGVPAATRRRGAGG